MIIGNLIINALRQMKMYINMPLHFAPNVSLVGYNNTEGHDCQNDILIPNGSMGVNGCSERHVLIPSELWK